MATYKNVQITGLGLLFKNETTKINADGKETTVQNFELTCDPIKSNVLFKLTQDKTWKSYSNQTPEDPFSYDEIDDPKYPTVKEVYLAQRNGQIVLPEEESNLEKYDWKKDNDLGWYLDRDGQSIKMTTQSQELLYPGDNELFFKGNPTKRLTIFCFSPSDRETLEQNGGHWNTETIDGVTYEGYISSTDSVNPTFPAAEWFGQYKTQWGTLREYEVNYCSLVYTYNGFILPKISQEDDENISVIMDETNNLIDYEIIDQECTSLRKALSIRGIKDKGVFVKSSDGTYIMSIDGYESYDRRFTTSGVLHDIGGKKYLAICFACLEYGSLYPTYVNDVKQNATGYNANYPAYQVNMEFGYYQNNPSYEMIVTACASDNPDQHARGQRVNPILISSNP